MIPATSFKDFYKVDHRRQYPDGTILVYSNFTPRKSRVKGIDKVVFFGLQYFIKDFLENEYNSTFFHRDKKKSVAAYKRRIDTSLGKDAIPVDHIEKLWDLQYLPIEIKALPEGSLVDIGVPCLTIRNTKPDFYWLTNDLETILSCELWQPTTSATIAFEYKKLGIKYAQMTGSPIEGINFQFHDFSFRGMAGRHAAMSSGAGHLLSFVGSDTIPAIDWLEEYYKANAEKELIATSIPATEHSVMCMGTKEDEFHTYERLIFEVYPGAYVGLVSDTWSLENVVNHHLVKLKNRILARGAQSNGKLNKVVIRPDSGDPVKILTGYLPSELTDYRGWLFPIEDVDLIPYTENNSDGSIPKEGKKPLTEFYRIGLIEALWNIFGGTINEKGYKVLNPCIGAIYGDSITLERAEAIFKRLEAKGFASSNVVFGVGSYTYQYVTRDTFGFAMKATYGEVLVPKPFSYQGIPSTATDVDKRAIWKDPETDDGTKKSAKGLLSVVQVMKPDPMGNLHHDKYVLLDECEPEDEAKGSLKTVWKDGVWYREYSLSEIRKRLASYL